MASWSHISLWVFIWVFNTRRYTIVHGFCLFKLLLMGGKELKLDAPDPQLGTTVQ